MQRGGNTYYYHQDDLFNVVALTDGTTGEVVEQYAYADYGAPTVIDTDGDTQQIGNPYRFTGRRFDAESSMYYYRTRYMDPEIGRFISRDTIGLYGDPNNLGNGQAYVGNNPWTLTDPYGEATMAETLSAFGALYGDEGIAFYQAYANEGSVSIENFWWGGPVKTRFHAGRPYAIRIDEDLNAIESAQALWTGLKEASAYRRVSRHLLGEDTLFLWNSVRQESVGVAAAIAEQGAQYYLAGLSAASEGADWTMTVEEIRKGNHYAAAALLPFVTVGMVKGGGLIVRRADGVEEAFTNAYFIRVDPITGKGPMAIDTSDFSGPRTPLGGVRNLRSFWREWNSRYDETLSAANQQRIARGKSPTVDEQWLKYFPEHADFVDEPLHHHHLGGGPLAYPLPKNLHNGRRHRAAWH